MFQFRLNSPVVAIEHTSSGMHIIHLDPGSILRIPETDQTTGLVNVVHHGRNISVFLQDISERAERVDIEGA